MTDVAATTGGTVRRDITGLEREVRRRLQVELSPALLYHDAAHTLDDVVPTALSLAEGEGIVGVERERLHAAALLHDIGYTRSMRDHEMVGAAMASELLPDHGFDAEDVAAIAALILATRLGHPPENIGEAVIADADLAVVGRDDFWHRHRALQRELASLGQAHDDAAWAEIQQAFLRRHVFHTDTARARGGAGKAANERRVATRIRRLARLAASRRARRHR